MGKSEKGIDGEEQGMDRGLKDRLLILLVTCRRDTFRGSCLTRVFKDQERLARHRRDMESKERAGREGA